MWLITTRGFYSVVEKPEDGDGVVTVRARVEQDIRNLADLIDAEATESRHSDYQWRVRCPKAQWAEAVRQMALEIDYDNFKNRIYEEDPAREQILARVWSDLRALQRD